jgi:leader peptidase (prepilin peptidase)/N-methyltransferase
LNVFSTPGLVLLAAALPAGLAAAFAAHQLSHREGMPPLGMTIAMIVACAVLGLWAATVMPTLSLLCVTCALGWTLLVLATVDALALRLPDILTLPLIAAGIAVAWWLPEWRLPDQDIKDHVIGAAVGLASFYSIAVLYRAVRGQEGLGLGDMKLAGAAGAWLGWQALPFVVLLACAVGLVSVGIAVIRRGKSALEERIPFGIALAAAIWVVWLYRLPDGFDLGG